MTQSSSTNQANAQSPHAVNCPEGGTACTVTAADGLNVRDAANTNGNILFTVPQGGTLCFTVVVQGENVAGNSNWGSDQGGDFFWLGGTDHPNG